MDQSIWVMAGLAASAGVVHTIIGPDHYLPFIVLAKARKWSMLRTFWITIVCGIGHVGSTILLGFVLMAVVNTLDAALENFIFWNEIRGNITGWLLIVFGVVYAIYGIVRTIRNQTHNHGHSHDGGVFHHHPHLHLTEHKHSHNKDNKVNITPWILFLIFVFGPCEAVLPFLGFAPLLEDSPVRQQLSTGEIAILVSLFAITTIITMLILVMLASYGLKMTRFNRLERHTHTIAGAVVAFSGMAIIFLGW